MRWYNFFQTTPIAILECIHETKNVGIDILTYEISSWIVSNGKEDLGPKLFLTIVF